MTRSIFGQYNWNGASNDWGGIKLSLITEPKFLTMIVDENTDPNMNPIEPKRPRIVNDSNFCYDDATSAAHDGNASITYLDGHSGKLKGNLIFKDAKYKNGKRIFCPVPP